MSEKKTKHEGGDGASWQGEIRLSMLESNPEHLSGLEISKHDVTSKVSSPAAPPEPLSTLPPPEQKVPDKVSGCRTCCVEFEDLNEMRAHFKLDWHRFNLKLTVMGRDKVSEEEFEDQLGDMASLSGSDSSSEEEDEEAVHAKVPYYECKEPKTGRTYRLWRNAVPPGYNLLATVGDIARLVRNSTFVCIMSSGGHFAAGVFKGAQCIDHKTCHRYVVRKKAGQRQSVKDGASSGSIKSAGSSIRRHNEVLLENDILGTIGLWRDHIANAALIFIYAPGVNKKILLHGPSAPFANDPRVRSFPFTTRRPTFEELKRAYHEVMTVRSVKPNAGEEAHVTTLVAKAAAEKREAAIANAEGRREAAIAKLAAAVGQKMEVGGGSGSAGGEDGDVDGEADDDDDGEANEIISACHKGDLSALRKLLSVEGGNTAINTQVTWKLITPLHVAAHKGHWRLVGTLLDAGADPTIRDGKNRPPYALAGTKDTRDTFRRHMARHMDQWDYVAAQIPSPLTEEMEAERTQKQVEAEEKEKEKQRLKKKKQKEKKKVQAAEEALAAEAAAKKKEAEDRASGKKKLSPEEQMRAQREACALAAERRLNVGGKCAWSQCNGPVVTSKAFERLGFKYCSVECMQAHRKVLGQ